MLGNRSKMLLSALLLTATGLAAAPAQAGTMPEGAESARLAAFAAVTPQRSVRRNVSDTAKPRRAQSQCRSIGCPHYVMLGVSF